jgi:glycosyltransferase involved in cell wall biosynthesis
MTNVCMITTAHSPLDNRIFYKEAVSLKKAGYEISVIGHTRLKAKKNEIGIDVIGLEKGSGLKSNPILWMDLAREALKIDADIYHCHEPESYLVALYLKIFHGKKIVYDVHEYYVDVIGQASLPMKFFLSFMLYLVEPLFCRYADAIITADDGIAKRYKKFNKNVVVVFNFPTVDVFKCAESSMEKNRYAGRFVLIYVGGLSEERGILELIKAAHLASKTHPELKLVIIGEFRPTSFGDMCIEYVRIHRLEDSVEFLGYVPHKDIPQYINASNVGTALFHATRRFIKTAYPIKLFEYMICGKPVLVSDLPAIRKIIEESKCGLLADSTDIVKVAESIEFMIEHPRETKAMGDSGRMAVQTKYNWSNMEKILLKIYKKISEY